MKRKITILLLAVFPLLLGAWAESGNTDPVLVPEKPDEVCTRFYGNYEMRNVLLANPVLSDSTFCITRSPEVNGETTTRAINVPTLEIRLDELNLKLGDPLIISVYHSPGCTPSLINPEVIDPRN